MWVDEFGKILNDQFLAIKQRNPKYSIRAFSSKIGLTIGPLSNILKGKTTWQISSSRAAQILAKLEIDARLRNRLLVEMGEDPIFATEDLKVSDYAILLDWAYAAVLTSFDLPEHLRLPESICKRFALAREKVDTIFSDLIERGILVREGETLRRPTSYLKTSDGPPSEVIRAHHKANLDLAREAIDVVSVDERDFTSFTFAGSRKQLQKIKEEIRSLYERAPALVDAGEENESVFRLSIQLFPLERSAE